MLRWIIASGIAFTASAVLAIILAQTKSSTTQFAVLALMIGSNSLAVYAIGRSIG